MFILGTNKSPEDEKHISLKCIGDSPGHSTVVGLVYGAIQCKLIRHRGWMRRRLRSSDWWRNNDEGEEVSSANTWPRKVCVFSGFYWCFACSLIYYGHTIEQRTMDEFGLDWCGPVVGIALWSWTVKLCRQQMKTMLRRQRLGWSEQRLAGWMDGWIDELYCSLHFHLSVWRR